MRSFENQNRRAAVECQQTNPLDEQLSKTSPMRENAGDPEQSTAGPGARWDRPQSEAFSTMEDAECALVLGRCRNRQSRDIGDADRARCHGLASRRYQETAGGSFPQRRIQTAVE